MLKGLVASATSEARDLEFKREVPDKGADATKEFVADVTSLANAQGGLLIFGIEEAKDQPTTLVGVPETDADAEIFHLDNILRDVVEPRLIGVRMQWVSANAAISPPHGFNGCEVGVRLGFVLNLDLGCLRFADQVSR